MASGEILNQLELLATASKNYTDKREAAIVAASDEKYLTKEFMGEDPAAGKLVADVTGATAAEGTDGEKLTVTVKKADLAAGTVETSTFEATFATPAGLQAAKTELQASISAVDGKLANYQPLDAGLTSVAALEGAGVVKMTATDTFAVDTIKDADIAAGEAIDYAKNAFAAKDGSVKTTAIKSDSTITIEAADDGEGHANVTVKTTAGTAERLVTKQEMDKAVADATAGSATYKGKFKYYAEADTVENAKLLITGGAEADRAVVFGKTDNKIAIGTYTTDAFVWVEETWHNGYWAWVEDIMTGTPAGTEYPSGRIVYDFGGTKMDVIEDRIGKPDENTLTYTSTGAIAMKMYTNSVEYGETQVLQGVNAANVGYGEGMTVKEKIASIEVLFASDEEVEAMLTRVFGA